MVSILLTFTECNQNISSYNCLQERKAAMSELDCPGEKVPQGNGKSFKGVENFLKRVAFNLGKVLFLMII